MIQIYFSMFMSSQIDLPRGWVSSSQEGLDEQKCGPETGSRKGKRGKKPVPLYSIHPIPMVTLISFATPYTFKIKSPCGAGSGW